MIPRRTLREIFEQLAKEGLVEPTAIGRAGQELSHSESAATSASPWFVRALVGVGAWASAMLFLAAIGMAGFLKTDESLLTLGVILDAVAIASRRLLKGRRNDFVENLSLALSIAGQALVIVGVGEISGPSVAAGALGAIVTEGIFLLVYPDPIRRFLSVAIAGVALGVLLKEGGVPRSFDAAAVLLAAGAGASWLWKAERGSGALADFQPPLAFGSVVALFIVLQPSVWRQSELPVPGWPSSIGLTAGLLVVAWRILAEHRLSLVSEPGLVAMVGIVLLGAMGWRAPGILAASGGLALAFHRRSYILLGLAAIFLGLFGSSFYYWLDITLLEKSGALAASGILLLAVRQYIVVRYGRSQETVPTDREGSLISGTLADAPVAPGQKEDA